MGKITNKIIFLASLMILLGGSVLSNVWADSIIYSQASNYDTYPVSGIYYSGNNTTLPLLATAADNFTLQSTLTVNDVEWQGGYQSPGTISSFTITFYSNNGGVPGTTLLTETISGNANETLVGVEFPEQPTTPVNLQGPTTYNYSLDLTTPFVATAGTEYWLSIVPTISGTTSWGWHTGIGGDGTAYQSFVGPVTSDLAFSLTSTSVPEPCTMLLLGTGIVGLAGFRRKYRKS